MMADMSDRTPPPGLFRAMPAVGTILWCVFCRKPVTLRQAPSGWHYWTGDGEPVDGGRHCLGGQSRGTLRTLHKPENGPDGATWAWRYDPDGAGRLA